MLLKEGLDLKQCGIYSINCILTGKVYIGSSINIERRYRDHYNGLLKNRHTNHKLQKAYNDHPDSFYFDLVEVCSMDSLIQRENYWIQEKGSADNGFNLCRYSNNIGTKNKASIRKLSKLKRDKMLMEDFYESIRVFSLYKDKDFPVGVTLAVYDLNITDGKQCPTRFSKLGKILTRCIAELYTLEGATYKISHVNYLTAEGDYRITKQEGKLSSNINKVVTDRVYDRLAHLVTEGLSCTKDGRKCLDTLRQKGIDLLRYSEVAV